ncbi:Glutaredoxin-C9 [Hibiscus syriacus]|uniref:Glutaredoxin-C9 n=1 Tax=Hibiscus syriacus TaxID=106335 RepID=A0A6A2XCI0_HIBSY|nr:glutaredoxin-C9-like [Hibiscus syriacus]KAE8673381.1 Glutaredoxin-C9 [Hibiscus syriacus]
MQEAIPYKSYSTAAASGSPSPLRNFLDDGGRLVTDSGAENGMKKLVEENAVVVFGRRGCCMCHVVIKLLLGHGVNPVGLEVDEGKEETAVVDELSGFDGGAGIQFPAVFVGGKLFGGLDRVMSTHISGELVPILKDAGALWL